jgi:uncharacterized membrane protein
VTTTDYMRPLAFGEILDAAMGLFARNFRTFLGTIIVCLGASSVFAVLMGSMMAGMMQGGPDALQANLGQFVLLLGAFVVTYFIGSLLASGATVKIVSEGYLGRGTTVGEAVGFAAGKFWRLFLAGLASALVIGLASILLIIPGIIVAMGYSVVTQIVVLERLDSATDALGRSWELTKGFKWRALGLIILASLIAGVPAAVPDMMSDAIPSLRTPLSVLSQLLQLALTPVLPCVLTVFYYDLRVRKEAFDLELLSQQLGPPTP